MYMCFKHGKWCTIVLCSEFEIENSAVPQRRKKNPFRIIHFSTSNALYKKKKKLKEISLLKLT